VVLSGFVGVGNVLDNVLFLFDMRNINETALALALVFKNCSSELVGYRTSVPNSSWKIHPICAGSRAIIMPTTNIDGSRHAPVFGIPKVLYLSFMPLRIV
jgi:hypothetical protein